MQLFSEKIQYFQKSWKVEKTTLKSCSEKLKSIFFLTAWAAKTAQTEELMLQNVAYRPTVYRKIVLKNEQSASASVIVWSLMIVLIALVILCSTEI